MVVVVVIDLTYDLTLSSHGQSHPKAVVNPSSLSSLFAFHFASLWLWGFFFKVVLVDVGLCRWWLLVLLRQ